MGTRAISVSGGGDWGGSNQETRSSFRFLGPTVVDLPDRYVLPMVAEGVVNEFGARESLATRFVLATNLAT